MRHALTALAALASIASIACSPGIAVEHWHPAAVDVGGARHAIVTDGFGRGGSVDAIGDEALAALGQTPWFRAVTDLRRRDRLETDGGDAWLRHGVMVRDAVYLRFDVYEDHAVVTRHEEAVPQPDGSVVIVVDERVVATTLIAVTVADHRGVILEDLELEGRHEQGGPLDDHVIAEAMRRAARAAVAAAVNDIAPRRERVSVPVDERDEAVNRIVRPVMEGPLEARLAAIDALADLAQTPAVYNRAVLLESVADLDAALVLYRAAARAADAPDFAGEVLAGAERRAADARAVGLR